MNRLGGASSSGLPGRGSGPCARVVDRPPPFVLLSLSPEQQRAQRDSCLAPAAIANAAWWTVHHHASRGRRVRFRNSEICAAGSLAAAMPSRRSGGPSTAGAAGLSGVFSLHLRSPASFTLPREGAKGRVATVLVQGKPVGHGASAVSRRICCRACANSDPPTDGTGTAADSRETDQCRSLSIPAC